MQKLINYYRVAFASIAQQPTALIPWPFLSVRVKFLRRTKCLKLCLAARSRVLWGAQGSGEWRRAGCGLLGGNARDLLLQRWLPAFLQGADQRCVPARRYLEQPQQDPTLLRYQALPHTANTPTHSKQWFYSLFKCSCHPHTHTHTEPCDYSFTSLLFMSWLCSQCQNIKLLPIRVQAQMPWPLYKMLQNEDGDFWSVGNRLQMCYGLELLWGWLCGKNQDGAKRWAISLWHSNFHSR